MIRLSEIIMLARCLQFSLNCYIQPSNIPFVYRSLSKPEFQILPFSLFNARIYSLVSSQYGFWLSKFVANIHRERYPLLNRSPCICIVFCCCTVLRGIPSNIVSNQLPPSSFFSFSAPPNPLSFFAVAAHDQGQSIAYINSPNLAIHMSSLLPAAEIVN